MDEMIKIIWMAILQGIAEFLPISSSGHLALFQMLFGSENETLEPFSLMLVLHAGTLVSVFVVYWNRIWSMFRKGHRIIIALIIATCIPTGIIGLLISHYELEDKLFSSPWVLVFGFFVTSAMLYFCLRKSKEEIAYEAALKAAEKTPEQQREEAAIRAREAEVAARTPIAFKHDEKAAALPELPPKADIEHIGFLRALWIGLVQGIAILPGISRSGATISAAVKAGISRKDAAAYSFIISLPAIGGATLLEIISYVKDTMGAADAQGSLFEQIRNALAAVTPHEYFLLTLAFVLSAVVGIIALKVLIKLLENHTMHYFAIYCFALGMFIVGIQCTRALQEMNLDQIAEATGGVRIEEKMTPFIILDTSDSMRQEEVKLPQIEPTTPFGEELRFVDAVRGRFPNALLISEAPDSINGVIVRLPNGYIHVKGADDLKKADSDFIYTPEDPFLELEL